MNKKLLRIATGITTTLGIGMLLGGCGQITTSTTNQPSSNLTPTKNLQADVSKIHGYPSTLFANSINVNYAKSIIGNTVPTFSLPEINGHTFSTRNELGKDYILVFGETNCSACIDTYPQEIDYTKTKNQVPIFEAFPYATKSDVLSFLKTNYFPYNGTLMYGNGSYNWLEPLQFNYSPTILFVNKKGIIKMTQIGVLGYAQMHTLQALAFN
jgi:hypothetical protein